MGINGKRRQRQSNPWGLGGLPLAASPISFSLFRAPVKQLSRHQRAAVVFPPAWNQEYVRIFHIFLFPYIPLPCGDAQAPHSLLQPPIPETPPLILTFFLGLGQLIWMLDWIIRVCNPRNPRPSTASGKHETQFDAIAIRTIRLLGNPHMRIFVLVLGSVAAG